MSPLWTELNVDQSCVSVSQLVSQLANVCWAPTMSQAHDRDYTYTHEQEMGLLPLGADSVGGIRTDKGAITIQFDK